MQGTFRVRVRVERTPGHPSYYTVLRYAGSARQAVQLVRDEGLDAVRAYRQRV